MKFGKYFYVVCIFGSEIVSSFAKVLDLVCGTDFSTYSSDKFKLAQIFRPGLDIAGAGSCEELCSAHKPVCGSDAHTYFNICLLGVAITENRRLTLLHHGNCHQSEIMLFSILKVIDSEKKRQTAKAKRETTKEYLKDLPMKLFTQDLEKIERPKLFDVSNEDDVKLHYNLVKPSKPKLIDGSNTDDGKVFYKLEIEKPKLSGKSIENEVKLQNIATQIKSKLFDEINVDDENLLYKVAKVDRPKLFGVSWEDDIKQHNYPNIKKPKLFDEIKVDNENLMFKLAEINNPKLSINTKDNVKVSNFAKIDEPKLFGESNEDDIKMKYKPDRTLITIISEPNDNYKEPSNDPAEESLLLPTPIVSDDENLQVVKFGMNLS